MTLELTAMSVPTRVPRVLEALDGAGPEGTPIDALLVTNVTNICYLTGFTGSAALLLVHPGGLVFITDGRYGEHSAEQLASSGVEARIEVSNHEQKEVARDVVAERGIQVLGLEADHVSWSQQRTYANEWFGDLDLVPTSGLIEELRLVKDAGEVARIEAAARIADQALANVRRQLCERPTEREFSLVLDTEMRRLGATAPSFETIVASGPNGALPHARPSDRVVSAGDLVVLDFGAVIDGYCSDMSRTIMVGEPSPDQQRMLDVVREAQQAGVDAVRPGIGTAELDKVCRDVIEGHGLGEAFLHSTGHGVGLDIHERPRVGPKGDATLAAGYVVTVEPGVYLPEHGGVRIEDTVVVTDDGCRALTLAPKTSAA